MDQYGPSARRAARSPLVMDSRIAISSPIMDIRSIPSSALAARMADRDSDDQGEGPGGPSVGIATRTRTRTKKPSLYKVLMLNDDYTPMEFVVHVLQSFFRMDMEEATRVMLHVHQRGVGVCGIFSYEVAETKVNQVMDFARQNQHPLQCTLEKA
ncbi:ATP-dependent Clp protease adapter ClpS [Sphingobium amiense]|uniref:ATP-dependent Clp protease adapter protein ClpS n=2 Tax=Sphingobium amiense TaxID=135719 RepID=A0A494WD17_9SPHN|nr:ATP-dependent Clp protease adapter ClpS [Sphingobium amiense]